MVSSPTLRRWRQILVSARICGDRLNAVKHSITEQRLAVSKLRCMTEWHSLWVVFYR